MLADFQVEQLLSELAISERGRELVRKVRQESPVRKVESNLGNVVEWVFSHKMGGKHLRLESRTVEASAATLYENDPAVLEYWPQPVQVNLVLCDASGTVKGRTSHTPDFLLIKPGGIILAEWREESRLIHSGENSDQFYKDLDCQWHYRAAEDHFATLGLKYELHSAVELPRKFIGNIRFLKDYNLPTCPELTQEVKDRLVHIVGQYASVRFLELIGEHGFTADAIFTAVAKQIVYVDLLNERLDDSDELVIHRDASIARAYRLLQMKQDAPTLPYPGMRKLAPGTIIKFNNQDYEVKLVSNQDVLLRTRNGEILTLPVDDAIALCTSNAIEVEGGEVTFQPRASLADFSESQLAKALKRLDAVSANDRTIPKRTLQRWQAKINPAMSRLDTLIALVDRNPDKGNRTPRLPPKCEALAEESIGKYYNTARAPTKSGSYLQYKANCIDLGVLPMSFPTYCKRVDEKASVAKRRGKRKEYQTNPIPLYLDYREPIHGVRPHEVCYVDHTILNLATKGKDGQDLKKLVFSVAIDGNTTQARAFYLSYNRPSSGTVLMVLRDYVRRHHRLPRILVVDRGPEFRSKELEFFCSLYAIDLRFRPRGQPRHGSPVERAMGYTESEFIALLEGNTLILKEARIATKSVEPFQYRKWTLPALWRALDKFLFEVRANRPHPVFGVTPNEFEQNRIIETGTREHLIVRFDSNLLLLTSPHPQVFRHRIDEVRGVWADAYYYCHDDFRSAKPGERGEVRVEMWADKVVYVYFRTRWVAAIARDLRNLPARTRYEVELAIRDWRRNAKNDSNKARLGKANAKAIVPLLTPENFDSLIHEQQEEMRLHYDHLGMGCAIAIEDESAQRPNIHSQASDTNVSLLAAKEVELNGIHTTPFSLLSVEDSSDSTFWGDESDFV